MRRKRTKDMLTYIYDSEIFETTVFFKYLGEAWHYIGLLARVLEECPELLETVELTVVVVFKCLSLELFV